MAEPAVLPEFRVDDPRSGIAHVGLDPNECVVMRARDEPEWNRARAPGIWASEVSGLLNIAPPQWNTGTKLKLYHAKVSALDAAEAAAAKAEDDDEGESEDDDELDADYGREAEWLEVGRYLEPSIALMARDWIRRDEGLKLKVIELPEWSTFRSEKLKFLGATPDRLAVEPDTGDLFVLELKSADFFRRDDWLNDKREWVAPLYYQAQVQQQMLVLGRRRARIAALIGRKFVHFYIERNDRFLASLIEVAAEFWTRVERRQPPPATAADFDVYRELHPRQAPGKEIDLDAEGIEIARLWDATSEQKRAIKANVEGWKARMAELMGDAEIGKLPDGRRFKFAQENTRRVPGVVREIESRIDLLVRALGGEQAQPLVASYAAEIKKLIEIATAPTLKRVLRKPAVPRAKKVAAIAAQEKGTE